MPWQVTKREPLIYKKEHLFFLHIMARRVMLQPAACPSPMLQNAPLPDLKTWTDICPVWKRNAVDEKKKTKTKRRRPTKTEKNAYQSMLRGMTFPARRGKKRPPASTCPCLTWCKPFLAPTRSWKSTPIDPLWTVSSVEWEEPKRNYTRF